ncbi:hypothetical protein RJT34_30667 [Clitoria ternatea]|uniref:RPW8 domain-containing protein n=1 Tax=Clitoria ternatea TaxID=43366 RepID=A0AAN9ETT9_CLITE
MFMNKMVKVKVLIITNYDLYRADIEKFELLDYLSELKRIRLEKVSIPFVSRTGVQLKNLQKLTFFMCNVNEAFKNGTIKISDVLPNLKDMNIDSCDVVELPAGLFGIVSLKKLSITNCDKFSTLPEEIRNLESLKLTSCSHLEDLPGSITRLHNLRFLDISDCQAIMAMVLDAVVGAVVGELLSAVLEMKEKAVKFRPTLEKLEETLKSLDKLVKQIDELNKKLDRPAEETKKLIDGMKRGRELVLKCNKVQWWNCCHKADYQGELQELDEFIVRFFNLDMQAQINRNGLETLVVVREIRAELTGNRRVELRGVCSPPQPPAFTVALDLPLMDLKIKLLREQVTVSLLTVTGTAGSGKSTLAKKFCWDEQVQDKFKENIFFVTFAKTPKLNTIVQRLYQHAGYQVPEFQSDEDAVNQLEHLLKQIGKSPILLVLDDVWPESVSLVDNFVFQIPNYIILVTSRFAIGRFGPPYVLKPLDEANAIELFRREASLDQTTSNVPDEVIKEIVRGCSGSPLALRVSGRTLSHQQPARIPAAVLVDIWAEFHHADDASAMEKIYELVNRNMADIVITRNIAGGIVDYNYHYVTQHGLLRDLAILQTNQEPTEKRKRLNINLSGNKLPEWWNAENEFHVAARILSLSTDEAFTSDWCNLQPTEVEVLVLNLREKKRTLPKFMNKMSKLEVLIITNYDFYQAEIENFELLDYLSELKRIRLEKVSIPFLSKTGVQLKNLQKFSFFMCNVSEAFKNGTVQISDVLPNLEEINIDYCGMVELPAGLSNIVSLKKLSITNCHKLSTFPEGIENLVNLESIRLTSCTSLVEFPESITSLQKLKFLDISDCISLSNLPNNIGKLGNLEKLNCRGCSRLAELPDSVTELEGLRDVVCDEETAALWEPYKTILTDLRLDVTQVDSNLNWLF